MIQGLNDFSAEFAAALFEAFPWLREHARLDEHPQVKAGSLAVNFSPPPVREHFQFWISTDRDEITVGFGMFHCHFEWPDPGGGQFWDDPLDFIRELIGDQILVLDWTKDGKWSGSSIKGAGETPDLSDLEDGCIGYLRSWSGKLDRVFSGEAPAREL